MSQFTTEHHYKHGLKSVIALYYDLETTKKKLAALGARNIKLTKEEIRNNQLMREIERELPATPPKVIQKFINPWNHVKQTEHWTNNKSEYLCDINVKIKGVPVTIETQLKFKEEKSGCRSEVKTQVKCKLPLIGRVLEDFVSEDAKRYIEEEHQFIKTALNQ